MNKIINKIVIFIKDNKVFIYKRCNASYNLAGGAIEYTGIWAAYTVSAALNLPFIAAWFGMFAGI